MKDKKRIQELLNELTAAIHLPLPSVGDKDVNEILGEYDGRLMLIRELWDELAIHLADSTNDAHQ